MASPVEDEDTDPTIEIIDPNEIPDGEFGDFDAATPPTLPCVPPPLPPADEPD